MNAKPWRTHAVGAALLLGIAGFGVFAGVLPELDRKEVLRSLNVERTLLQESLHESRDVQRKLREELVELQELGADWASQRASRASLNHGMASISTIANDRDVVVGMMRTQDPRTISLFNVTKIELQGEGGYDDVALFMSDIVAQLPNVTVDWLEMRSELRAGTGTFSMHLTWYADGEPE